MVSPPTLAKWSRPRPTTTRHGRSPRKRLQLDRVDDARTGLRMTLIACSECKKQISDQACSCPHCGSKLSSSKRIGSKGCLIGCLLLVVVVVGFVFYSALSSRARFSETM